MPLIDFPSSPAVNDQYTFEGRTWLWNGNGWEIKAFSAGVGSYTVTTTATSKTASANEFVVVTAASQTITLPASPAPGNQVGISVVGTFVDTVVARNGSNIMSLAENMTIDVPNTTVELIYTDATRGWRIMG